MSTHPNSITQKKSRKRLILLILLLLILFLGGLFLLLQATTPRIKATFIPVSLHSVLQADYSIDSDSPSIAGVELDIIWDIINDLDPDSEDLEARQADLLNNLLTPVPTVTPSFAACQGIHFIYAAQDTWTDSTNPNTPQGQNTQLQLGQQGEQQQKIFLHFPLDDVLPPNTLIHSARLEMDIAQIAAPITAESIAIFNLSSPFFEPETSWSNQPQPYIAYPVTELANQTIQVWDITTMVQDWMTERHQNVGMVLAPQGITDFTITYYSREIIEQRGDTSTQTTSVGPRLIINCGGTVPQAVALNSYTPAPETGSNQPDTPNNPATNPPPSNITPQATPEVAATTAPPTEEPTLIPSPDVTTTAVPLPSVEASPLPTTDAPPTIIPPPADTPTPVPPDSGGGNNNPPEPTATPQPLQADMTISLASAAQVAIAGQTFVYTLTVTNQGPDDATTVTALDTLPAGVPFVVNTPRLISPLATCNGSGLVTCNFGTVPNGNSRNTTLTITVDPDQRDPLVNSATVSTALNDPVSSNNSTSLITPVEAQTDLIVDKQGAPNPVVAGERLTYTLAISNAGPSSATNVVLTDTLPSGVTFQASSSSSDCSQDGGDIRCLVNKLDVGDTQQRTIVVLVDPSTSAGSLVNQLSAAGLEPDPDPTNNFTTITTTVTTSSDLMLTKQDSSDPTAAGGLLTYTLGITNLGPSNATGVLVTDTLPVSVSFISASAGCTEANGLVSCNLGSLATNDISQIDVTVLVSSTIANGTFINNSAIVSSDQPDPDPSNNTATESTRIDKVTDLSVTKLATPNPVSAGQLLTYTLFITNYGPSDGTGIVVTDTLPAGITFHETMSSSSCTGNSSLVTCAIGALNQGVGVQQTIVITVNSSTLGFLTNQATVAGVEADTAPANNSTVITTTIVTEADVALSKIASPNPVIAGELLTYTLSFTNYGPSDAENVSITDSLPGGVFFNSDRSDSSCSETGGTVTCPIGNLMANTNLQRTVVVTVDRGITPTVFLVNNAIITTTSSDPLLTNNSDSTITTVEAQADLAITKSASPDPVIAGGVLTYSLMITNYGPSDASTIVVTDTLPSGVIFDPIRSSGNCTESGGLVTCITSGLSAYSNLQQTVVVTINTTTSILTNTAQVTATTVDPVSSNNSSAATTTVTTNNVSIFLECVVDNGNGTYTAFFGYSNPNGVPLNHPIGPDNRFSPIPEDRGQPTIFPPGRSPATPGDWENAPVSINELNSNGLVWILNGRTSSASSSGPQCSATNLALSKTANNLTPAEGESLTYSITINNLGSLPATGVLVNDTIPISLTYVTYTSSQGSYDNSAGIWNVGTVPSSGSATLTLTTTVNGGTSGATIVNTATISQVDQTAPQTVTHTAQATITVTSEADLSISKQDTSDPVTAGETLTYTLQVINNGPSTATDVVMTDTLPVSLTVIATDATQGTGCSPIGLAVSCNLGTLAVGATANITITVNVDSDVGGVITNTATVASSVPDSTLLNNTTVETTTITPLIDLAIAKIDNLDPYLVGEGLIYTLTITNNGPGVATGLIITDTLPAGVAFDAASAGCSLIGDLVTCNLASLAINATTQLTISVDIISTTATVAKVYWADYTTNRIQRGNPDGSGIETLVIAGDGIRDVYGLDVDASAGKMYWTDNDTDKIQRANLDGSNIEDLVTTGLNRPEGIALDVAGGKMYWADFTANRIQRANLDGSNVEDLITAGPISGPSGIALDVAGGKMYWTNWNDRKIQRANLDGSSVEDLIATGLSRPEGITLDVAGGKMYWADFDAGKIQRANLDGSNIEDLITSPTISGPGGITVDVAGGKIYWTDWSDSKVQRANLDGSDIEDLATVSLNRPHGIALQHPVITNDVTVTANETDSNLSNNTASQSTAILGPTLSINSIMVPEGDSGTTTAIFSVTLSSAVSGTVTVDYATTDSSATAGSDYGATSGTLTFLAGTTVQTFSVVIDGDTIIEGSEFFVVNLSNPSNAMIRTGQGIGSIIDEPAGISVLPNEKRIFLPLITKSASSTLGQP
ncbi:MAG: DNRLRE domain-containing protein [Chloroflexota bacterium]